MGLFDKKYCSICGEKIGLLGNRKLEDGNLCKDCAKKLPYWFDDRRHSTVDEIKAQLAYREENQKKVDAFIGKEIKQALTQMRQETQDSIAAENAPKTPVVYPFCGATTFPNTNGCCEYCGGPVGT